MRNSVTLKLTLTLTLTLTDTGGAVLTLMIGRDTDRVVNFHDRPDHHRPLTGTNLYCLVNKGTFM